MVLRKTHPHTKLLPMQEQIEFMGKTIGVNGSMMTGPHKRFVAKEQLCDFMGKAISLFTNWIFPL